MSEASLRRPQYIPAHAPPAAEPGLDAAETAPNLTAPPVSDETSNPAPTPAPATTQTTAPPVPPQAGSPALPPALATDLTAIVARQPEGPVEITLAPEELGRLRITLSQEGDVLRIIVQAERGETLDLLRRNADVLMQEIRSSGFSGGTFSFSGWGGGQGGAAAQNPSQPPGTPPRDAPHAAQLPAPKASAAQAGLDLRL